MFPKVFSKLRLGSGTMSGTCISKAGHQGTWKISTSGGNLNPIPILWAQWTQAVLDFCLNLLPRTIYSRAIQCIAQLDSSSKWQTFFGMHPLVPALTSLSHSYQPTLPKAKAKNRQWQWLRKGKKSHSDSNTKVGLQRMAHGTLHQPLQLPMSQLPKFPP